MNEKSVSSAESELLESCLEIIAQRVDDISPKVYQRFFAQFPDANELFGGTMADDIKGGMIIDLLLQLLELANGKVYHHNIERWINDHMCYGVTLPMYSTMFESLVVALKEVMGSDWSESQELAWSAQIEKIMAYVERIYEKELG